MNILYYKQRLLGRSFREDGGGGGSGDGGGDGGMSASLSAAGYNTSNFGGNIGTVGSSGGTGGGPIGSDAGAGYNPTGVGNIALSGTAATGGWSWSNALNGVRAGGLLGGFGAIAGGIAGGLSGYSPGTSNNPDPNAGNTTGGGMDGSSLGSSGLSSAITLAGSINSLFSQGSSVNSQVQTSGDPFAPYRSGLAAQYAGALAQGSTVDPTKMPGYSQWQSGVLNPAMEAQQGKSAAAGMSGSGAEKQALQGVAQQGYSGFMNDYMNRLATGSGASQNPLGAAQLGNQVSNANQQATMQGLGAIGQGIQGLSGYLGGQGVSGAWNSMTGGAGYGGGISSGTVSPDASNILGGYSSGGSPADFSAMDALI